MHSGASTATTARSKLARTVIPLHPSPAPPSQQLKVLQWNILADGLAQHGDFVKVPSEVLEWSFRAPLMLAEILESGADVICLQECNHYDELLKMLRPRGYCGAFYAKSFSPACRYDCPPDGLAIFYRSSRLEQRGPAAGHTYMSEAGCRQSQGFLAVRLHDTVAARDLLVVTTHLKAKEGDELDAMRLRQANQLLAWLDAATGLATVESYDSGDDLVPVDGAVVSTNNTNNSNGAHADASDASHPAPSGRHGAHAEALSLPVGNGASPQVQPGTTTAAPDSTNGAHAAVAAVRGTAGGTTGSSNGVHPPADNGHNYAAAGASGSPADGSGNDGTSALDSSPVLGGAPAVAGHNGVHASAVAASGSGAMPIILTGDFNTTIGSPACKAFSSHQIGLQCLWSARAPPDALAAAPAAAAAASAASAAGGDHPVADQKTRAADNGRASASVHSVSVSDDAPQEFTTWKYRTNGESKRIIDFIMFTHASLRPTSRWRMLSEEEIGPHGLPSAAYGSDHVAVCASFEWRENEQ